MAASAGVGALVLAAPGIEPSASIRANMPGFALLGGSWLLLDSWALLYALLLRRLARVPWERALFWAALCHTPILLSLGMVPAIYGSDLSHRVYAGSDYGRLLFQPLAVDYLVLAPALAQALLLAGLHWRVWVRHLPILAIALLALALRLSHAGWGLPALLHPDEHRYYGPATIMAARGDLNPHYFQNPSLMIYLTYLLLVLLAPQSRAFLTMDQLFNLGILNPRGDFLDLVVLRGAVAVVGVLTVIATYLAGRELLSRRAALFGAGLLAVSFLHVRNSHYATNDVLATGLLAISFLFSARIYTRGRLSDYLLAGLFGGLGTSAKYNVGLFAAAILVAHLARVPGHRQTGSPHQNGYLEGTSGSKPGETAGWRRHLLLLAAAGMSLGGFLLGTPYALLDFPAFASDFRDQLSYGSEPWFGQQAEPSAQIFLTVLAWGLGLLPLLLAFWGGLSMGRREKGRLLLLLAVPASYFLFMSTQKLFFARFALPALPFLALLAGQGLDAIGRRWKGSRWPNGLTILLLAAATAQPLSLSLQHDRLLARADTRFLAAQWIDSHLPRDASLAVESYAQLDPKFGWKGYQVEDSYVFWPENEQTRSRAMSGRYQFVVVSSFGYGPWQGLGGSSSTLPPQYRSLEEKGRLVAVFAPGYGNSELPYAIDDMYTPFWHLFDRERPGPTVRIYEMD